MWYTGNYKEQIHVRVLCLWKKSEQIIEPTRNENILDQNFTTEEDSISDMAFTTTTYSYHKLFKVKTRLILKR